MHGHALLWMCFGGQVTLHKQHGNWIIVMIMWKRRAWWLPYEVLQANTWFVVCGTCTKHVECYVGCLAMCAMACMLFTSWHIVVCIWTRVKPSSQMVLFGADLVIYCMCVELESCSHPCGLHLVAALFAYARYVAWMWLQDVVCSRFLRDVSGAWHSGDLLLINPFEIFCTATS